MNDGLNIARTAMAIQGFQQRQEAFNEQELAKKYFGMKLEGQDIPQGEGYDPKAELMADELVNRKWQAGQTKQLAEAEQNISKMTDEQVLTFQPESYAEHLVAASRIKMIGSNKANRQVIDEFNKKKAAEAYHYSTMAFSEAQQKYANGDFKGAAEELVKIGQITNNPFKARPSEDGKTVELYWTKDGEDQPGQKYPIDQALQIVQENLNGEEFFKAHLANREARKKLNEEALLNPIIFEKGNKQLRAIRELDLNTNQIRWSVYDEKGNLYGGQPIADIGQLYKEGWTRYNTKAADAALKREKLTKEIDKIDAQAKKAKAEITGGMTEKEKRAYRQKRLKYVNDRIKAMYPEGGAKDLSKPEMTALRQKLADEYDEEVLGNVKSAGGDEAEWVSVKRNKQTGEVVYLDGHGNVVKREKGKTKTYTINKR